MVKTIIKAFPTTQRKPRNDGSKILYVSECFCDTIQGENIVGFPSTFLRLQGCTLNCVWCDTKEVWRKGNPYSVDELIELLKKKGVVDKLCLGQHLVLTGGSPLKQQVALEEFLIKLVKICPSLFVEIENEGVLKPNNNIVSLIDVWNNSIKLSNSKMKKNIRYKPDIIKLLSLFDNSYFKFVVSSENDWLEIKQDFLETGLIKKEQIVLMPEGQTREELQKHYDIVVGVCVREGVRFTDRLHVTIWNKKTGV